MYTGYLLSPESRTKLLERFPAKYEKLIAHHITETFGVPATAPPPPQPDTVAVVGYIDSGDGVEGLLVAINGSTDRPDKSKYHITWSLSAGRKAVETNKYVSTAKMIIPIPIKVEPKTFTK